MLIILIASICTLLVFDTVPCLISALLIPTLAAPLTGPLLERVATAMPPEGTTAPVLAEAGYTEEVIIRECYTN